MALVAIALHCGGGNANAGALAIDFSEELVSEARSTVRDDGQVTLTWQTPRHSNKVELQQGSTARFTDPVLRYHGTDTGSVITGLPEGAHFFRVRALDENQRPGPWSDPFEVKVVFMERDKLALFLGTGGLVVALTVGTILTGYFRTKQES